jgi:serine/threonine-protein kinase
MLPKRIAHYEVIERVAAGGMGVVYRALDTHLGRSVALKVLPQGMIGDPERRRRFEQEARAASALNHPNIITIHDIAEDAGILYIAMEYIQGRTLAGVIPDQGLPAGEAISIAVQMADALATAHARGIIHRDLKPTNVMVTEAGLVKVLDFGLAKFTAAEGAEELALAETALQTEAGLVLGTVSYMSPEQARGSALDARSDIFSFGAVLHQMLTGRQAFPGDSKIAILSAILSGTAEPMGGRVPPGLQRIVDRCLRKNPDDRFQRLADVKLALEAQTRTARPTSARPSIAVLPFVNLSADRENEYFSDGLAEDIIDALTHVPGLRVTARTSAFSFRGRDVDVREIGERLGVAHLLEGSVRKAGSRIRVTVQLIESSDGCHVWSERYDREMTDVFAIQDDISQAIVEKLRGRLVGDKAPGKRETPSPEAYNLVLKGRHYKDKVTRDGLARAKAYFEQALVLDPQYAMAHYGMAETYWHSGYFGFQAPREVMPHCKSATLRALELDEGLAEAHAMLGMLLGDVEYDWEAARQEFERALELAPGSGLCRDRYGFYYLRPMLCLEEAALELRRALELDPLSLLINNHLAYLFHVRREYDSAAAQFRSTLDLDPNYSLAHWLLAVTYSLLGDRDAAVAEAETLALLSARSPLALCLLAASQATAGRTGEVQELLAEIRGIAPATHVPPFCMAWVALAMDDLDQAMAWLERAVEEREPMIVNINQEPYYDKIRSDPRYHALVRKMNLRP